MTLARRFLATSFFATATCLASCSISEGEGTAQGTLNVADCWSGAYDLQPDFFTAAPYRETSLLLRIQKGGDYQSYSDGFSILVDDIDTIRKEKLGMELGVDLPPNVVPLGRPAIPDATPAPVSAALYLQATCRTQNVALYAVDRALLDETGECNGDAPPVCDLGSVPAARIGTSRLTFNKLYNGVIDEPSASERLIEGNFDFYLVDPREICNGGSGTPPRCRGHISGQFRFYFQRGRPAQAFP